MTYVTEGRRPLKAVCYSKHPYGGVHDLYALTAALTRAVYTRQVRWFRIDTRFDITPEIRASLARWPEALELTSQRTGVTWE